MNLKRLPIFLIVTMLVSSLAACTLPISPPAQAPGATQDNRIAMTLTAIQANNQATTTAQPPAQPSVPPATSTTIPTEVVSQPPALTPTAEPVATSVPVAPAAVSVSGMKIVYTDAGRNLWIWLADGSNSPVGQDQRRI